MGNGTPLNKTKSASGKPTWMAAINTLRIRIIEQYPDFPFNKSVLGKWVYAIMERSNKCSLLAEIHAQKEDSWRVWKSPDTGLSRAKRRSKTPKVTRGFFEISMDSMSPPAELFFLISPWQLQGKALDKFMGAKKDPDWPRYGTGPILDKAASAQVKKEETCYISLKGDEEFLSLYGRDPSVWAETYHQSWIKKYDKLLLDIKKCSKQMFIAETLKAIIGEKDPTKIRERLAAGQPDKYLNAFKARDKECDEALSKQEQFMNCKEYLALEDSAREWEKEVKVCRPVYDHYLRACIGLRYTEKGRKLLQGLINRDFPPAREIFTNDNISLIAGESRDALAGLLDFYVSVLLPEDIKAFYKKHGNNPEYAKKVAEEVQKRLEKLKLTTKLTSPERDILRRLKQRPPGSISPRGWHTKKKVTFHQLAEGLSEPHSRVRGGVSGVLDLVNLYLSAVSYGAAAANASDKWDKMVCMVQASFDLLESSSLYLSKSTTVGVALKGLASKTTIVFGLISSGMDVYLYLRAANKAEKIGDDDAQYAYYGAAVGGALGAASGLMVLLGEFAGMSALTKGVWLGVSRAGWVGFAGAILLVACVAVAAYLTDTEIQTFASNCFLSKGNLNQANQAVKLAEPEWTSVKIGPNNNFGDQFQALVDLLTIFKVDFVATTSKPVERFDLYGDGRGFRMTIRPPALFIPEDQHFEIVSVSVVPTVPDEKGNKNPVLTKANIMLTTENAQFKETKTDDPGSGKSQVANSGDETKGMVLRIVYEWKRENLNLSKDFYLGRYKFDCSVRLVGPFKDVMLDKKVSVKGEIGEDVEKTYGGKDEISYNQILKYPRRFTICKNVEVVSSP